MNPSQQLAQYGLNFVAGAVVANVVIATMNLTLSAQEIVAFKLNQKVEATKKRLLSQK